MNPSTTLLPRRTRLMALTAVAPLLVFGATACSSDDPSDEPSPSPTIQTTEAAEPGDTVSFGQTAILIDGVSVTTTTPESLDEAPDYYTGEGEGPFLHFDVEITNASDDDFDVLSLIIQANGATPWLDYGLGEAIEPGASATLRAVVAGADDVEEIVVSLNDESASVTFTP